MSLGVSLQYIDHTHTAALRNCGSSVIYTLVSDFDGYFHYSSSTRGGQELGGKSPRHIYRVTSTVPHLRRIPGPTLTQLATCLRNADMCVHNAHLCMCAVVYAGAR